MDEEETVKRINAATKAIHKATGQGPTEMCAHIDAFLEMGIDPTIDGEDLGGGFWRVSIKK